MLLLSRGTSYPKAASCSSEGSQAEEADRELGGALLGGERTLLPGFRMELGRKDMNKEIKKTAGQFAMGLRQRRISSPAPGDHLRGRLEVGEASPQQEP